jgi:hypothetical protein
VDVTGRQGILSPFMHLIPSSMHRVHVCQIFKFAFSIEFMRLTTVRYISSFIDHCLLSLFSSPELNVEVSFSDCPSVRKLVV